MATQSKLDPQRSKGFVLNLLVSMLSNGYLEGHTMYSEHQFEESILAIRSKRLSLQPFLVPVGYELVKRGPVSPATL